MTEIIVRLAADQERAIEPEWFDFPGYGDRYQITKCGRVRSKSRMVNSPICGEQSPSAKLNDEIVIGIKRRLAAGQTHASIAKVYGVVKGTIGFIARGETWSHIEIGHD